MNQWNDEQKGNYLATSLKDEMSTASIEETPTVPVDGKTSQQEDVLAQVKVLLEEIRAPKGNMQSYSGTWMRDQLCWACGKRGHFRRVARLKLAVQRSHMKH